ncbi:hypothetical protein ACW7BJ_16515 [Azospirillum argentinense]
MTTRRKFLASATSGAAVAGLALMNTTANAAPKPRSETDTPLLDICRRWREMASVIDELGKEEWEPWETGPEAAAQRLDAACAERSRLAKEILDYRPLTTVGVLEKLRVIREFDEERFDCDPCSLNWEDRMFLSALDDLERLAN